MCSKGARRRGLGPTVHGLMNAPGGRFLPAAATAAVDLRALATKSSVLYQVIEFYCYQANVVCKTFGTRELLNFID